MYRRGRSVGPARRSPGTTDTRRPWGISCSAACTVTVPDATIATSASASTRSVWPSTMTVGADERDSSGANEIVVKVGRARDDELDVRDGLPDPVRGVDEPRQDLPQLVAAASRKERNHRTLGRQPDAAHERCPVAPEGGIQRRAADDRPSPPARSRARRSPSRTRRSTSTRSAISRIVRMPPGTARPTVAG